VLLLRQDAIAALVGVLAIVRERDIRAATAFDDVGEVL
jgi:hypothetical protein